MPQKIFKQFEKLSGKDCQSCGVSETNSFNSFTKDCDEKESHEVSKSSRVFVGGIAHYVNEWDLKQKFLNYGSVKAVKIIRDCMGASKGYGFVTFTSEDDAKKTLEKGEIIIKGRKLNIAPAVRKQINNSDSLEVNSLEKYEISSKIYERRNTNRKNYKVHKNPKSTSDYSSSATSEDFSYFTDSSNFYSDHCDSYDSTEIQYGNQQVNLLPYPMIVFLPQQIFHCAGTIPPVYHVSPTIPGVHALPAPICYFNEQILHPNF